MEKMLVKEGGKTIAEIFLFIDTKPNTINKNTVLNLAKNVSYNKKIGYAGYKAKQGLSEHLKTEMLGKRSFLFEVSSNEIKKIKNLAEKAIKKCNKALDGKTFVFIFPTASPFAIRRMNGVSGFSPWKNTITIFINPIKDWEVPFEKVICHEYFHALQSHYHNAEKLKDFLVADGLAEHFQKYILDKGASAWTQSVSKEKSKSIFKQIKPYLGSKNREFLNKVFFGAGKYPLWAGYAIGYYLMEEYAKGLTKRDWKAVSKLPPSEILKNASFS